MKWYRWEKGKWQCLHCDYNTDSLMGIQSHIRKHKNEHEQNDKAKQTRLNQ